MDKSESQKSKVKVSLIDFGLAHTYLNKKGKHIDQPERASFKGSLLFCSINALKGQCKSVVLSTINSPLKARRFGVPCVLSYQSNERKA
jgi:hypothetical protein